MLELNKIYKVKEGHERKCEAYNYYRGYFIRITSILNEPAFCYDILNEDKYRINDCVGCFTEDDLEEEEVKYQYPVDIKTYILNNVEIQQNGIIRNSEGYLIGRLVDNVDFEGEHIKDLSVTPLKDTVKEIDILDSVNSQDSVMTTSMRIINKVNELVVAFNTLKAILGKHKVIGDTTYGLGYAEADKLANELIALFTKKDMCTCPDGCHGQHNEGNGCYICDSVTAGTTPTQQVENYHPNTHKI